MPDKVLSASSSTFGLEAVLQAGGHVVGLGGRVEVEVTGVAVELIAAVGVAVSANVEVRVGVMVRGAAFPDTPGLGCA